MLKKIKNIKIIYAIYMLIFISIISIGITVLLGFRNMSSLNDNIVSFYNKDIPNSIKIGNIKGEIGIIRVNLVKVIDRAFSDEYVKAIEDNDKLIRENLKGIENTYTSDINKNTIGKLKNSYDAYMEKSRIVIEKRSKGESIDQEFITQYNKDGSDVTNLIDELTKRSYDSVTDVFNQSINNYNRTKKIFVLISAALILVFILISTMVLRIIKKSVKEMINILNVISNGDFTVKINTDESNEFGIMKKELADTVKSVSEMINNIKESTKNINGQAVILSETSQEMTSSSQQVSDAIEGVANGSTSQATELMDMTSIIGSFSNSVDKIVSSVKEVTLNTKEIDGMANISNKQLENMIKSIDEVRADFKNVTEKISELGLNIKQINEITALINSVAEQTNLLALNAAIEAARAGESGRGFAVVAEEIRKLAEQSKSSSLNIENLVKIISNETESVIATTSKVNSDLSNQVDTIDKSISSFKDIILAIEKIIPLIENVNDEIKSIDKEKNHIMDKVETASAVAEENSASSEEIAAASKEMDSSAKEVENNAQLLLNEVDKTLEQVNKFKL